MCSLAPTLSATTLSLLPPTQWGATKEGPRGPSVEGMRRQVEGALDRVDAAEKRVGKVAHRLETRPPPGGGGA